MVTSHESASNGDLSVVCWEISSNIQDCSHIDRCARLFLLFQVNHSLQDSKSMSTSFLPDSIDDLVEQLQLIPHPEGGFYRETHRSGSVPLASKGQTDFAAGAETLVQTFDRSDRRPDGNVLRNAITSIYWVPTLQTVLPLSCNVSDHVHYYQGGNAFEYTIYDPKTHQLSQQVLGPDLLSGQKLQVPIAGGVWKAGRVITLTGSNAEYTLIAEAVAPGFDFHDFDWVTLQEVKDKVSNEEDRSVLEPFLYQNKESFQAFLEREIDGAACKKQVKLR